MHTVISCVNNLLLKAFSDVILIEWVEQHIVSTVNLKNLPQSSSRKEKYKRSKKRWFYLTIWLTLIWMPSRCPCFCAGGGPEAASLMSQKESKQNIYLKPHVWHFRGGNIHFLAVCEMRGLIPLEYKKGFNLPPKCWTAPLKCSLLPKTLKVQKNYIFIVNVT